MAANSDGRKFRGAGTALVTPFTAQDGSVDWPILEWLINKQIDGGIDFLVPCGTTGESPTLDHREHAKVIKRTVLEANGRVPVLAGTGSNNTAEAVRLTEEAAAYGADGVLVVSPYYNKPMPAGFLDYYRKIADVGLPVILYDIPGRTAKGVPLEVILQLRDEGTIAGMKWASGNFEQAQQVLSGAPGNFAMLSGDDGNTFQLMQMGGHGVVSVLSNLLPMRIQALVQMASDGNWFRAEAMNKSLSDLMGAMFIETNPQPIKEALAMRFPQIFRAAFRSPMMPMEEKSREQLRKALIQAGELSASGS